MDLDDIDGSQIEDLGNAPDEQDADASDEQQSVEQQTTEPEEVFGFDGDEHVSEDAPTDSTLVKRLREELRERDRRLAAIEKPAAEDQGPGPRPTLEDCGYDEDAHAEALLAWADKRGEAQRKADEAKKSQEASAKAWADRVNGFQAKAQELKLPDFAGAVQGVLDHFQPGIGMDALKAAIVYADDPRLVLAIKNSPATVEKLKALGNDALAIGVAIGELKGKIRTVKRDAPTPEKIVRGGTPVIDGADKHLAKLEAAAQKSGQWSEVLAYKREQKRKER